MNSEITLTGGHGVFKNDEDTGSPQAVFTAVIKRSNINTDILEDDTRKFRLYLLCDTNSLLTERRLAYLEVSPTPLSKIEVGTDGIVEWIMEIINLSDAKPLIQ